MRVLYLAAIITLLSGCGIYSFKGEGVAGIKSIAVESLDNQTTEFGIREQLSEAIVSKLLADRTLTVAAPRSADAVLTGTIVSISDRALTYSADESVSERQVSIRVVFKLLKPGESEPIWEGDLVGEGTYPNKVGSPDERNAGIVIALDMIVKDLINRLTSDW